MKKLNFLKTFESFETIIYDSNGFIIKYNDIDILWTHNSDHNMLIRVKDRTKLSLKSFNMLFIKLLDKLKKDKSLSLEDSVYAYFLKSEFKIILYVKAKNPLKIDIATILDKKMYTKDEGSPKIILLNETITMENPLIELTKQNIMKPIILKGIKSHYLCCFQNDNGIHTPIHNIIDDFAQRNNLTLEEEKYYLDTIQESCDFMNESGMNDYNRLPFDAFWEKHMSKTNEMQH
jgi:hypothetical protein